MPIARGVLLNVASLHQESKPCYSDMFLASLVMSKLTEHEEVERLRARFIGVNRAEFARLHNVPGGAAMIYQHITGRRPISIEAAQAYAKGFGCKLEDISPRLADEARAALAISQEVDQLAPTELLEAWELLTPEQRQPFIDQIKAKAAENRSIFEQVAPIIHRTVNVHERRRQMNGEPPAGVGERRKKNAKSS